MATVTGTAGNDSIIAGTTYTDGTDTLSGLGGNDTIYAGVNGDLVYGGADNDLIDGGAGADTLYGDTGDDTIYSGTGGGTADRVYGGEGNDYIYESDFASGGADSIVGGNGIDTVDFSGATEDINLTLSGGSGTINPSSTGNTDSLVGIENIVGTAFDDSITGDNAANLLDGGDGSDSLSGGLGNDTLIGGVGIDRIYGGNDADLVFGGNDGDLLSGNDGLDTIYGDAGNDTIYGDAGNDSLYGGEGIDRLADGSRTREGLIKSGRRKPLKWAQPGRIRTSGGCQSSSGRSGNPWPGASPMQLQRIPVGAIADQRAHLEDAAHTQHRHAIGSDQPLREQHVARGAQNVALALHPRSERAGAQVVHLQADGRQKAPLTTALVHRRARQQHVGKASHHAAVADVERVGVPVLHAKTQLQALAGPAGIQRAGVGHEGPAHRDRTKTLGNVQRRSCRNLSG